MNRIRSILVPHDFSAHADAALALAAALARENGAALHLFHTYEIPLGAIPPYGILVPDGLLESVREAAARELAKAARAAERAGVTPVTHLAHATSPPAGIAEAAQEFGADLIVMGTHGLRGIKHALLGSVAERTARIAPCPVLTVRAGAPSDARFRKLLVPLDFSPHTDQVLELAIELAKQHGAELHLLHAYSLPVGVTMAYGVAIPPTVWEGLQEAASERLAEALARVKAAGLKAETHLVTEPAADAVTEAAAELGADLIVMGTHGLTGLKHALLGSVAERVLRTAPCPVLIAKQKAA
jgi:nucleotide-binding universal stress UspA family protein